MLVNYNLIYPFETYSYKRDLYLELKNSEYHINESAPSQKVQFKFSENKVSQIGKTISKIAQYAICILADIGVALFLGGPILLFAACYKTNFDPAPSRVKLNQTPILLIHGNGSNETQWLSIRHFLSHSHRLGSVFTLNLDGLASNDPKKGIPDYALKVADKINTIKEMTKSNDIILVGHSMGGLVGTYYAENYESKTGVKATKVITIATPWRTPFTLKLLSRLFPKIYAKPIRLQNMRNEDHFIDKLKAQALHSQQTGKRKYYSIACPTDSMIGSSGRFLDLPKTQQKNLYLVGHYTSMFEPRVQRQLKKWIYDR